MADAYPESEDEEEAVEDALGGDESDEGEWTPENLKTRFEVNIRPFP